MQENQRTGEGLVVSLKGVRYSDVVELVGKAKEGKVITAIKYNLELGS